MGSRVTGETRHFLLKEKSLCGHPQVPALTRHALVAHLDLDLALVLAVKGKRQDVAPRQAPVQDALGEVHHGVTSCMAHSSITSSEAASSLSTRHISTLSSEPSGPVR